MGAREEVWHSKLASTLLEQRVWGDIDALLLQQLASAAVSDGALHLEFVTLSKAHWPVSWQLPQGPAKVPYTGYFR